MFSRLTILGILLSIFSLHLPVRAETCTPITLVGGEGSEVTKTVAQPTIPGPFGLKITRNNWNTDWAVPGGVVFRRYIATITSRDGGSFDIAMFLKYSDQTADEFFNTRGVELPGGKPLTIEATPRPEDQPYQVNIFVNGLASMGKTYTASVVACR